MFPFHPKNDGIVGVDTAMWDLDLGPGTHLGTVAGLTQYVYYQYVIYQIAN